MIIHRNRRGSVFKSIAVQWLFHKENNVKKMLQKLGWDAIPFIPTRVLRLMDSCHEHKWQLSQRKNLQSFREFYDQLENKQHIFYMSFLSGYLHWVAKALEFIPKDTNIVLIGHGLTKDELSWINRNTSAPLFCFDPAVSLCSVWKFLFKINEYHFGWIDIDCFVLNKQIFHEMTEINNDVAINCAWTRSYLNLKGLESLYTPLLYLNADIIKKVESENLSVMPCDYGYALGHYRIPKAKHIKLLRKILVIDNRGRVLDDQGYPLNAIARFDYLFLYQLITQALGYKLHRVRKLKITKDVRDQLSNELLHMSTVTQETDKPQSLYDQLKLQAEYLLIRSQLHNLPDQYQAINNKIERKIEAFIGTSYGQIQQTIRKFLVSGGIDERSLKREVWQFLWSKPST